MPAPSSAPWQSDYPTGRSGLAPNAGPGYGGPGYGGGYPGTGAIGGGRHVSDYVRVLVKRRWVAITSFVLVMGFVVLYTYTTPPLYVATAQVMIHSDPNVVTYEEVLPQDQRAQAYLQTQYRLLSSRVLARRTLDNEKLWGHPVLTSERTGIPLNPVTWLARGYSWARGLADGATPASQATEGSETATQTRVINRFLGRLTVAPVRNSLLVDLRISSTDPQFSALTANALAKAYIEQNLEFTYTTTKEASEFLSKQMDDQRKAVSESEIALQQYRERTDSVSLEERQNIVVQRLAELNAAVTKAQTDRRLKEAAYEQINSQDRAQLDTVPAVLNNAFVQQLKVSLNELQRQKAQMADKFGAKHPDMQTIDSAIASTDRKLQTEIAKVVQAVRLDYEAALAQEKSLSSALEQQKQEALGLGRQSVDYSVLQRNATSNQEIFDGLLKRAKETDISSDLRQTNVRIVDRAEVPLGPSSPNKVNNMMIGLVTGLFLAIGLAFVFEYLDNRIKSPEEIKAHLGLPFLGMIPALASKSARTATLLTSGQPPQYFAEAFRTIRTNVLFSSAEPGARSIAVTSTAPGEGKSLVSANLATALALAGQRVLLVDADLRRPTVHEAFDMPREPGLSNVLVGEAKASESVKRSSVQGLWILGAGKIPPNPAELLGSKAFATLLESLKDHFDWIIIDTPPVLVVSDAAIVAHLVTGTAFVVGAEMTSRYAARAALDQLDSAKARYVGAVLNRVQVHRDSYYYSNYYRREYQRYYANAAQ